MGARGARAVAFELTVNDSEQSVKFYKDMLGIDMPLDVDALVKKMKTAERPT